MMMFVLFVSHVLCAVALPSSSPTQAQVPAEVKILREKIAGPVCQLFVSWNVNDTIDYNGMRNQIDECIVKAKTTVVLLTAGDSGIDCCMTQADLYEVTRVMAEHVAGRAVTVGAHSSGPGATLLNMVKYAKYAKSVGTDVIMLSPGIADKYPGMKDMSHVVNWTKAAADIMPVMLHDAGAQDSILDELAATVPNIVSFKMEHAFMDAVPLLIKYSKTWAMMGGGQDFDWVIALRPYGLSAYMQNWAQGIAPEVAVGFQAAFNANNLTGGMHYYEKFAMPFRAHWLTYLGGCDGQIRTALEVQGIAAGFTAQGYPQRTAADQETTIKLLKSLGVYKGTSLSSEIYL